MNFTIRYVRVLTKTVYKYATVDLYTKNNVLVVVTEFQKFHCSSGLTTAINRPIPYFPLL